MGTWWKMNQKPVSWQTDKENRETFKYSLRKKCANDGQQQGTLGFLYIPGSLSKERNGNNPFPEERQL